MIDKLTGTLNFQARALELRSQRQSLLAANVANADTPGYRAVDMDFSKTLEQATRPAAATHAAAGAAPAGIFSAARIIARDPAQEAADGNGVDMDRERARFAENSVGYEAAIRTLNHQVKSLLSVIQG